MRIGLIDVDKESVKSDYPNLALMKISAWHKEKGDSVEWYQPLFSGHMDKVYMSKVFSFTPDYEYFVDADEVEKGGTGYAIEQINGRETFVKEKHKNLPNEIEHMFPDYSIYGITDTAYGFLSRGCPRGCDFCIVKDKEGLCATKVADLSEFWNGQKNICLCDPNILACKDWENLLQQLIDSNARVDFNQGLDIRMMTDRKAEMLSRIKTKSIHFAWDRIEDADIVIPRFEQFRKRSKINSHNLQVYVLVGDRKPYLLESDKYRVAWLKQNGYAPYVMIYEKYKLPKTHDLKKFQRYVNNRACFWKFDTFEEYLENESDTH